MTNEIAEALAAKVESLASVRSVHAWLPDSVPPTPAVVIGPHRATLTVGDREVREYTFPLSIYVARQADEARTQQTINDLVDEVIDAHGSGMTIGEVADVSAFARITDWRTDQTLDMEGGGTYQVAELTYVVTTRRHVPTLTA